MVAICALLSGESAGSNPIKSRKAIKRFNRRRVNGKPRSLFRETRREKRGSRRRNDGRRRCGVVEEGGRPRRGHQYWGGRRILVCFRASTLLLLDSEVNRRLLT